MTEPRHGDQSHLPGSSLYPIGFAVGIACILVGLVINPMVIAPIGAVIAIVFGYLWVRDATRELRVRFEGARAFLTGPANRV